MRPTRFRATIGSLVVAFGVMCAIWAVCCALRNRPVEHFVDVDAGGHRLHMCIVGDAGPVVVLESGLPGGLGFEHVRGPVSRFARAVAYDRAGVGASEPGPLPRDAKQIVRELHAALHNANLPPPYVLVGQSMGGPYVRVFAATYPDEVSGIVLVDPARADSYESMEDVKAWFLAHHPAEWPKVEMWFQAVPTGAEGMMAGAAKRFESMIERHPPAQREAMRREYWALVKTSPGRLSPVLSPGARDEFKSAEETFRQTIAARPQLPRVPIVLMVAGQQDEYYELTASLTPTMRTLAQDVKRWKIADSQHWVDATPGARLVVAQRSGHNIQTEAPGLVIDAIRDVIERGAAAAHSAR